MIICPNCGKELEDGTKFCDSCGSQVFETIFCPNCGEQTSTEFPFCQKCGAAIREGSEEKKGGSFFENLLKNKTVLFGGIGAIVAVIVIIIIVAMVAGGGGGSKNSSGKANYALYIKDGEINYTKFSKDSSMEITNRLDNNKNYSDSGMHNLASSLSPYVVLCSDGKTMFYPDRIEDGGFSLYYRNISKTSEEPTRVDTNISRYYVTDKGDQVFYLKDGSLYQNDLKDKTRIASDVSNFALSADGKKVLYRDDDDNLYIWNGSADKNKIASGIDSLSKYNDDLSVIYYMKEEALYKYENGENQKIASDIYRLVRIYNSGEAYYVKSDDEEINLMDYVDDDKAASDASMAQPTSPSRPSAPRSYSSYYYSSYEEYQSIYNQYLADMDAYNAAYEKYQADRDEYYAKQNRDYIRESLTAATISHTTYTLYYYDGSEATKVSDSIASSSYSASATERAVIAISVYAPSEVGKIRLSEIESVYDVREKVNSALFSNKEYNILVGSNLTSFDQNAIYSFRISADGSTVLFLDDVSNDETEADLYKTTIKGDEAEKPSLYDTDVSTTRYGFLSNGSLYYFKDVKDNEGELYIDKSSIDIDVYCSNVNDTYYKDDKMLFYYVDYNSDRGGTLKMYKGSSSSKVADDVIDFIVVNGDNILYLYDFSTKRFTGTMYLHDGKTATKIDDDVSGIIRVYDAETRRSYFAR